MGGQIAAFYRENITGAGKGRVPGDSEVYALQAIRSPGRKFDRIRFAHGFILPILTGTNNPFHIY